MQFFKGDEQEKKTYESALPAFEEIGTQKDLFWDGAFSCFNLGDIIWQSGMSPLANAIPQEFFREAFFALFDSFTFAGTFESYLTVFRAVFGDDVIVVFTVPAPGKLNIDITATGLQISGLLGRVVDTGGYAIDKIIDRDGNYLVGRSFKGLDSEYELRQMLFEMVPGGVYTTITLDVGGS